MCVFKAPLDCGFVRTTACLLQRLVGCVPVVGKFAFIFSGETTYTSGDEEEEE